MSQQQPKTVEQGSPSQARCRWCRQMKRVRWGLRRAFLVCTTCDTQDGPR